MPSRSTILCFAATNSAQSINKRLVRHAAKVLQDELGVPLEIEIIDLNDYEMPIYSPEREAEGIPQLAQKSRPRSTLARFPNISTNKQTG